MTDALQVPHFARFEDYLGAWAYEPERFRGQWELVRRTDLPLHVAAAPAARASSTDMIAAGGGKSIARVAIRGSLMKGQSSFGGTSTVQLRRDIRQAAANPDVRAILLDVESPGGTVAGTADLAAEVKAASRRKPVWAHVDDLAASAAYWVASQADMVFANDRTALVGSIGTIMTVYDYSAAAEKEGVKALVFATGPLKGAGAPGSVVTEAQQAYFQRLIDDAQRSFDAAVKAGRGLSAAELAAVRTGGVFPAGDAVGLKLIDGIRPIDRTLEALANAK